MLRYDAVWIWTPVQYLIFSLTLPETRAWFGITTAAPRLAIEILMTFSHAIWLAVAGGLGTLSRVLVIMLAVRLCGRDFPWGTFAVNLCRQFSFWIDCSLRPGSDERLPAGLETILLVGFLGGFTTYSSFAFQSYELFQEGRPALAGAYMVGTTISGLAAVWVGVFAGRFFAG